MWVGTVGMGCDGRWEGHIAPCRRSRRASTTGVGMSTASALAWIASMCGCRYDREAKAYRRTRVRGVLSAEMGWRERRGWRTCIVEFMKQYVPDILTRPE
jgi:hypothetical protein